MWWANFLLSSWISCLLLISCHHPAFLSVDRTQDCLAMQSSAAISCTAVYMILAHTSWTSEEYYEFQWRPLTQPQYKLSKVPLGSVTSWGIINHFVRHGVVSLRSPLSRHHFVVFFQEAASVFLKVWHVPYRWCCVGSWLRAWAQSALSKTLRALDGNVFMPEHVLAH